MFVVRLCFDSTDINIGFVVEVTTTAAAVAVTLLGIILAVPHRDLTMRKS
jgi:mannose/fructose/N-acetylgalactosamine-specific phosphotransferase system component IIC